MKTHRCSIYISIFFAVLTGALFTLTARASAQAVAQLPNLKALPAGNISLSNGLLSFSTTSWNSGIGRLELIAGKVNNRAKKQKVYQRVYYSNDSYQDYLAGDFIWHKQHNHFHFEQYALYTLRLASMPDTSLRGSQKTTFCIMDTTLEDIYFNLPGTPHNPVYSTCGNVKQGMSVGWGDTYGSYLAGQSIDVSGLSDGLYHLVIEIDPQKRLLELDDGDNTSCVLLDLRISTSTVTPLGGC